jgi:hypothetical protein
VQPPLFTPGPNSRQLLLFLITTPSYVLLLTERLPSPDPDPFDTVDSVFSGALVSLVIFEWFADQQQWTYQTAKANYKKTAKLTQGYSADDLDRGFLDNVISMELFQHGHVFQLDRSWSRWVLGPICGKYMVYRDDYG